MASEVIKLNLIPTGTMPVFHASQFDTGRLITCELYRGEDAYSVPEGYTVELHCRKVDNKIVTMASTLINDNVVTFTSTEQLTACNGNNLCEVAILDEGYRIGTLNFILEVEVDPLKGGITSTSEIHNLESQIEEITTEIIGENYYDKSEVDDLLSAKADSDSVYTIGEVNTLLSGKANAADVYTKSQTDILLNAKADVSDLPDMTDYYTKTATDALLDDKASNTYVDSALALKANVADVYTKAETDAKIEEAIEEILPVDTAGPSAIASFTTGLALPLVNCTVGITATGGNGTPDNPIPINGYTEANITANGNTYTVNFGQTVYGGVLDVTRGKLTVTHGYKIYNGTENWSLNSSSKPWLFSVSAPTDIKQGSAATLYEISNLFIATSEIWSYSGYGILNNFNNLLIGYPDANADIDALKTFLSNNNLQVCYQLETPFDIDLTPEVISAIVGTNNVYSDTNGDTTVQFKDSIQHYIDNHMGV